MKKHIYPLIGIVCLVGTIVTLLYLHFVKGGVTGDGWATLVMMICINMGSIKYWKEYFKK
jgi:hypothetical protein